MLVRDWRCILKNQFNTMMPGHHLTFYSVPTSLLIFDLAKQNYSFTQLTVFASGKYLGIRYMGGKTANLL